MPARTQLSPLAVPDVNCLECLVGRFERGCGREHFQMDFRLAHRPGRWCNLAAHMQNELLRGIKGEIKGFYKLYVRCDQHVFGCKQASIAKLLQNDRIDAHTLQSPGRLRTHTVVVQDKAG